MKRSILLFAALLPLSGYAASYTWTSSSSIFDLSHGSAVTMGLGGTTGSSNYYGLATEIYQGKIIQSATLTLSGIYDWTAETHDVLYVNILQGLSMNNHSTSSQTFNNGYQYDPSPSTNDTSFGPNVFNSASWPAPSGNPSGWSVTTQNAFRTALPHTALSAAQYSSSLLTNDTTTVSSGSWNQGTNPMASHPGTWSDPVGGGGTRFNVTVAFTQANLDLLMDFIENDIAGASGTVGLGFAAECHYYNSSVSLNIVTGNAPPTNVPDAGSTMGLFAIALAGLAALRRRLK